MNKKRMKGNERGNKCKGAKQLNYSKKVLDAPASMYTLLVVHTTHIELIIIIGFLRMTCNRTLVCLGIE